MIEVCRSVWRKLARRLALAWLPSLPQRHPSAPEGDWLAGVLLRYIRETRPQLRGKEMRHTVRLPQLLEWLHEHPHIDAPDAAYIQRGLSQLHALRWVSYIPRGEIIALMDVLEKQV